MTSRPGKNIRDATAGGQVVAKEGKSTETRRTVGAQVPRVIGQPYTHQWG